jgi:filamentous hemagglutinin family protein
LSAAAVVVALGAASGARANPLDGVVSAGSATITTAGNTLNVVQTTDRAVIDWRSFDIAAGERTQFYQPNSGSIAVNRVGSGSPSVIAGQLSANGNIVIVNPNGVMFTGTSVVDVGGLIATSSNVSNANVMAGGKLIFDQPGNPTASIVNDGFITVRDAGLVGFVAPNVINNGIITAKLGKVHLASGDSATVDFYGDGLINLAVSEAVTSQLVSNTGIIRADGGTYLNGSYADIAAAYTDGQVDYLYAALAKPAAIVTEIAQGRRSGALVAFPADIRKHLIDQYAYAEGELPAGTYPTLQSGPVPVTLMDSVILVHESVPDDIAYKVTKTLIRNRGQRLVAIHASMGAWDPATSVKYQGLPLHPGAIKAFREAGIAVG